MSFGGYRRSDLVRPRRRFLAPGVRMLRGEVERVAPADNVVRLAGGQLLPYTYLVIATGTAPRPEQTPGLLGLRWGRTVHEFYTLAGAERLAGALQRFRGGRVVVDVVDMPIKCPVAPLELTFLLDAALRHRGLRDRTELTYATPLPGAFTRPIASHLLGSMPATGTSRSNPTSWSSGSPSTPSSPTTTAGSATTCW
ncbi:hypothetical protein GCM10022220_48560 [Actinocatenispora rupis]|uniref:FAD/NAD(P)-binding oxidoreductase n=1 Tax=Actinocatenispora rupis TaxID=519421 RepID=UPI0031E6C2CE